MRLKLARDHQEVMGHHIELVQKQQMGAAQIRLIQVLLVRQKWVLDLSLLVPASSGIIWSFWVCKSHNRQYVTVFPCARKCFRCHGRLVGSSDWVRCCWSAVQAAMSFRPVQVV